jgi:voltage-gated potassium channel
VILCLQCYNVNMKRFQFKRFLKQKNIASLFRDDKDAYGNIFFDTALFALIGLSVIFFIAQTYSLQGGISTFVHRADAVIMGVFVVEVLLRIYYAKSRIRYSLSLANIIDVLAIVPFFIGMPSLQFLRGFRVLKMFRFLDHYTKMYPSRMKVKKFSLVFKISASFLVFLYMAASLLYTFEKGVNPKVDSFDDAIYLVVVTMTTVGYGDIVPVTAEGRLLIVCVIIASLFLIPIYLSSLIRLYMLSSRKRSTTCKKCGLKYHDYNAVHCKMCGAIIYQEFDDENS